MDISGLKVEDSDSLIMADMVIKPAHFLWTSVDYLSILNGFSLQTRVEQHL